MKKLILSLIAVCLTVSAVQAGDFVPVIKPQTGQFLTNSTLRVAAATTTNLVSGQTPTLLLQQGYGFSFAPSYISTNTAMVSNVVFRFEGLIAGTTNWTTTGPLRYTNAANGTNLVRGFVFFTSTQVDGLKAVKLSSIQNVSADATNTVDIRESTWAQFPEYKGP